MILQWKNAYILYDTKIDHYYNSVTRQGGHHE